MGWESGGPQIRFGGAKVVLYFEVCNFFGKFDENICEKCCEFYCGMGIGVDVFRKFVYGYVWNEDMDRMCVFGLSFDCGLIAPWKSMMRKSADCWNLIVLVLVYVTRYV